MWSRIFVGIGAALVVAASMGAADARSKYGNAPWARSVADRPGTYDPNAEIERRLRKLGLPGNSRGVTHPKMTTPTSDDPNAVQMLRRFDSDGNGQVSVEEFRSRRSRPIAGSEIRRQRTESRIRSTFRSADRDRNGWLSKDELSRIRNPRF